MNVEDYKKGFRDGASIERGCPQTVYIMGYPFDKIIELIHKDMEKDAMANRLMTKSEASDYCNKHGWGPFINLCIIDKVIITPDPIVTCLMSNDAYNDRFGTIRVEMWPEGLVLWVGGEIKWESWQ